MEDRVRALEERLGILEADEVRFQRLITEWADKITENVNEKTDGIIKVSLDNIQTMRNINKDLQVHYKTHFDEIKKREEYASKRKTYTIK